MFVLNAAQCQKIVGEITTLKGEKIDLYANENKESNVMSGNVLIQDVNLTAQYVYYYDKDGEMIRIAQSKLKSLNYGNKHFKLLPISSMGMKRLHEVIFENKEYVLTNYYHKSNYFYIFQKSDLKAVAKKKKHSWKARKDKKMLKNIITPYFSNCNDLLLLLQRNIETASYKREFHNGALVIKNNLFAGITGYSCN
jgi:hypothetical protein